VPVDGPDDPKWIQLTWPDNINAVASQAMMEDGWLVIYYSTVFPKFAAQQASFERRDVAVANSFVKRYEIWLAVHSLLRYQDELTAKAAKTEGESTGELKQEEPEAVEIRDREERCRIAVMCSMFAAKEVQMDVPHAVAAEA
jgi:hypothetical protein